MTRIQRAKLRQTDAFEKHFRRNTNMKVRLASILACLLAIGISAHAQDLKKIKLGVEGAYPPFSEVGIDGKLKGFDIDIPMPCASR